MPRKDSVLSGFALPLIAVFPGFKSLSSASIFENVLHSIAIRFSICALLFFAGTHAYAQTGEENALWNRFKNDVRMEQQANNGRIVWDEETKGTFSLLVTKSSVETLLKYTNDSLPTVRAKMFYGLIAKGATTEVLEQVLRNHANDTATFTNGSGCLASNDAVIQIMRLYFEVRTRAPADFKASLEHNKSQPKIIIAGAYHRLIAKEDLLKAIPFIYSEPGIKVLSFTLSTVEETIKSSNTCTPEITDFIQKLESGTRILIEDLRVKVPGGRTRKLNPLVLQIQ